jgi:hydrogenase-4 component B
VSQLDPLTTAVVVLLTGALLTAFLSRHRLMAGYVALASVILASISLLRLSLWIFSHGPFETVVPLLRLPVSGLRVHLIVDQLSAVFLFIIVLVAVSTTWFSLRAMELCKARSLIRFYPALLLFFATTLGVVAFQNMLVFLLFWELMTLTSYLLIAFETEKPQAARAGLLYFVAATVATSLMVIATTILYAHNPSHTFEFSQLRDTLGTLTTTKPVLANIVLALFLVGFGTKAGILPFGFWIPVAYPAAPTVTSAAMAGIVTKLGVYGTVRVFLDLLPPSELSLVWGSIIALLGTASIVVGTLTALQQTEAKRLLSFHVIGQIGYMWLGVGIGVAMYHLHPAIAVLGLMGGLFHVVNNASYKSLLFLNAGAVEYRTGTTELDRVGGLMHIMPVTTVSAIIASLSIAGVPPLSGFTSKWLIFERSIMAGLYVPVFIFLGLVAVFISAVTLASFMKFLATLFLGDLHVGEQVAHREVPVSMTIPQTLLAIVCVVFGVAPVPVLWYLYRGAAEILPGMVPSFNSLVGTSPFRVNLTLLGSNSAIGATGAWDPLLVTAVFVGAMLFAYGISRLGGARTRKVPIWLCGEEHSYQEIMYSSHSFLQPFNRYFCRLYPELPVPKMRMPGLLLKLLNPDTWITYPAERLAERLARAQTQAGGRALVVYLLWAVALVVIVGLVLLFAHT